MLRALRKTHFGNPVLRQVAQRLTEQEILSKDIQGLIANLRYTCEREKFGVGLAAPQVGRSVSISVIAIKPTPTRPDRKRYDRVLINPEIIKLYGEQTSMWEACISFGASGQFPYAQALRYKKIRIRFLDENAQSHDEILEGFEANVVQHEVDHLNGILFVDRVVDNKTFVMASEFKKRILPNM
jgi:peptide deformylase